MEYVQLVFNLAFIAGLILASISSVYMWVISKRLSKVLRESLPEFYTEKFKSMSNTMKYKELNQDLLYTINKKERGEDIKEEVLNIKKKYYLKPSFEEFFIQLLEEHKKNIELWQKVGNFSVKLTIVGAIISIIFIIF